MVGDWFVFASHLVRCRHSASVLCQKADLPVPSEVSLRHWKKAVQRTSEEIFSTLRDLSETDEKAVDAEAITLRFLVNKKCTDLQKKTIEERLVLEITSRYRGTNNNRRQYAAKTQTMTTVHYSLLSRFSTPTNARTH